MRHYRYLVAVLSAAVVDAAEVAVVAPTDDDTVCSLSESPLNSKHFERNSLCANDRW